jgi:hypothetical protein
VGEERGKMRGPLRSKERGATMGRADSKWGSEEVTPYKDLGVMKASCRQYGKGQSETQPRNTLRGL